jgi:hypothetical protein
LTTRFPWSIWAAVGSWRRSSSYTTSSRSKPARDITVRTFVVSHD